MQSESVSGNILDWYDFSARNYDPALGRWMNIDPLAEEFISTTPYNAMMNNPINFVDPDGRFSTHVTENEDGTHTVVEGGDPNDGDNNIYVVNDNGERNGKIIGESLTSHSFYDDNGNAVVGTIIDLDDQFGQNFFNGEITNVGLFEYIGNAKGGEPLDLKTRDMPKGLTPEARGQYTYRGMSFNGKVASARDIGNYAAGYVAGKTGFSWGSSRFAFDALETKQAKGTWNTVLFYPLDRVREGQPTQSAQRAGYNVGYPIFKQKQFSKATNPWPVGPKY